MADSDHAPESQDPPTSSNNLRPGHPEEDLMDLRVTHEEAEAEVDAHDFSATASEPPFEKQEATAYSVRPPTTHSSVPTRNPVDGEEMNASSVEQTSNVPLLPPRPPDDHPVWAQEPQSDPYVMDRGTTGDNRQREAHTDPAIEPLKSMFPDFDDTVLHSVLESVNGSQDAAVDVLLGMSDPTYVSTHHPTSAPVAAANPSLALDEQLARQLMLEDQRQEQEHQSRWRPSGQTWPRRNSGQGPPTRQPNDQPEQPQQTGQGERVQELKETFNQIAESGKRTFSSIVSKVKSKINEYEQSRTGQQQQQDPSEPSWGSSSGSQQSNNKISQQPAGYPSYYSSDPYAAPASKNAPHLDRHATSQAYAQYYTVGSDEDDGWTPVGNKDRPRTSGEDGAREVKGYDVGDSPEIPSINTSTYSPSLPSVTDTLPSPDPSASSAAPEVPRPPPTVAGSPINAAKLGLLPRRPVNLMSSQPTTPTPRHQDDDDEELDYVENPFEEHRK